MFIYFIFINFIYFTIQGTTISLLIDKLFKSNYSIQSINIDNCSQFDKHSFYYRGRPTNFIDIMNSKELKKFKYIYISEEKYLAKIILFPKSTIFIVPNSTIINSSLYEKDYCIITIDNKLEKYNPFYYIIIGKNKGEESEKLLFQFLKIFLYLACIIYLVLSIKLCCLKMYQQIFVFNFTKIIIFMNYFHLIFSPSIQSYFFPYIIYSFNKCYIYVKLIFLVNGFTILDNEYSVKFLYRKYFFFFFLFDLIITYIFIYIIYFIPSLNNFYLFTTKYLIYYIYLFTFTIKSIKNKLIPFLRQYRLERLLRTFFAIGYKVKLILYTKVIIFSLLYSLTFIILPLIQLIYINEFTESFYLNYYINTFCELFLCFLLSIFFYPTKITIFFYLPVFFNYNSRKIFTKIAKKNEKINILSNLTKNTLKKKYYKEKLPIVLIKPYDVKDNSFNDLLIGIVKSEN